MITHLDQVTEFPLTWPQTKPRAAERQRSPFATSMAKAQREIEDEMRRWNARGHVVSMAPAYRQGQIDPGVAVWWRMPRLASQAAEDLRVLACDTYPRREDNLHAIALTLTGLRAFERYGTYTREQAIEGARLALPAPEDLGPKWWEVLGVERSWPLAAIRAVYENKALKAHPDHGGSVDEMAALNTAIEAAQKERG